jgi:hypothetical protein
MKSISSFPSLLMRLERTGDFKLISLRPYVSKYKLDMNKPHVFSTKVGLVSHGLNIEGVYGKDSISCADDIIFVAYKLAQNVELRAHGIDLRMKAALFEAARKPECEHVKYILFQDPIHNYFGKNSFVLENTSVSHGSSHALVISLAVPVLNTILL